MAESHDRRFWIRKIKVPEKDNVRFLDNLIAEIPAFLHFLNNRKLHSQHESRMWFDHKLLITDAFRKLVESNKSTIEKELCESLRNLFIDVNETTIYATLPYIKKAFLNNKYDDNYIKRTLTLMNVEQYRSAESGKIVMKRHSTPFVDHEGVVQTPYTILGRPYVFERSKFISDAELSEYSFADVSE